eukprot:scaffold120662_cov59-Attheya_sp.AAC.1
MVFPKISEQLGKNCKLWRIHQMKKTAAKKSNHVTSLFSPKATRRLHCHYSLVKQQMAHAHPLLPGPSPWPPPHTQHSVYVHCHCCVS